MTIWESFVSKITYRGRISLAVNTTTDPIIFPTIASGSRSIFAQRICWRSKRFFNRDELFWENSAWRENFFPVGELILVSEANLNAESSSFNVRDVENLLSIMPSRYVIGCAGWKNVKTRPYNCWMSRCTGPGDCTWTSASSVLRLTIRTLTSPYW